jgi:hypothetical protein
MAHFGKIKNKNKCKGCIVRKPCNKECFMCPNWKTKRIDK